MNIGLCIHFDAEELIDGQGTCLWYDCDDYFKCIGWIGDAVCIDYETCEIIMLEKML